MTALLRHMRQRYIDAEILPTEVKVIDRLLSREVELRSLHSELSEMLDEPQLAVFWDRALSVAAFWNPERAGQYRDARKELSILNVQIAKSARVLAQALARRDEVCNQSGYSASVDYHLLDYLERGARTNYLFEGNVADNLRLLRYQYDLKYWPTIIEVISAVAEYAEAAQVEHHDNVTLAATSSPKRSKADYFRALHASLNNCRDTGPALLPNTFRVSDESVATLANCSLDLSGEEMVDGAYVKRWRQRERET